MIYQRISSGSWQTKVYGWGHWLVQHSVKDWFVEGVELAQTKPEHLMMSELDSLTLEEQVPDKFHDVLSKQS